MLMRQQVSISDVPPARSRGRQYKVIDVPGTRTRAVASSWHFEDTLRSMPFGPVLVTVASTKVVYESGRELRAGVS